MISIYQSKKQWKNTDYVIESKGEAMKGGGFIESMIGRHKR